MSSSIFGHLEASLHDYLADISRRAQTADDLAALNLARSELPRIAEALHAVLAEHEPDEHGRCRTCRTRRLGRAAAPCRAYLTAHLCLLVTGEDQPGDSVHINAALLRHRLGAPG